MCGIIGYVGPREAKPLLLQGLRRLEYRGYDSAGIALLEADGLHYTRAVGPLDNLVAAAGPNGSVATTGLGHTRWATHGAVTEQNAHPLTGCDDGRIAIVLNGIVENYRELKGSLEAEGHTFKTETDAEVVVHLIERHYDGDLLEATRGAYRQLEGHFAFVVIHHDHPEELVGARRQCPLLVGVGGGEMFLASMAAAFIGETRSIQLIEEWARLPVEPDIASEWIYRNPVLSKDTLVIGISQSGESRDTVNAVKLACELGSRTVAITNLMGSQITREAESVLYTRCGLEVAVASSKTFTAQVALLALIGLKLAEVRKTLPPDEIEFILDQLYELPKKIESFLDGNHPIEEIAQR